MMNFFKKNFPIVLITIISLGVIFYLKRKLGTLQEEHNKLIETNASLKKISSKAFAELEMIKNNFFPPQRKNHEPPIIDEYQPEIIEEQIIEDQLIEDHNPEEENIIIHNKKPSQEELISESIKIMNNNTIFRPPEVLEHTEFIVMSETIPDVESELVNNLIYNNLIKVPTKNNSDKIEEITIDDESSDEEPYIIEETDKKVETENLENKKVFKFNNNEKNKEETPKINIKLQPREKNDDSESEKSLDYSNNDYLEINTSNLPEVIIDTKEDLPQYEMSNSNIDYLSQKYNINQKNLNSLEDLKIKDIQEISKRYKIDIKKINSKGDKKINKTKKELCTEIISCLNI
jgi:hypothetical protein